MGQKIHPLGFRLGITQKHRSQWFAKSSEYPDLVIEDNFLRKTISDRFSDAGISLIEIQRKLDQIKIEIHSARPTIIVGTGRDKTPLESLRNDLKQKIKQHRATNCFIPSSLKHLKQQFHQDQESAQIAIHVTKLVNPNSQAAFIADFIAEQLEKRIAFRRAVRKGIQSAQRARVKGIKIQVSGRLNGAEIARSEWVREGRVPLHTLRADIDYHFRTAKTIYGLLGIKVWIFNGEINSPRETSSK